MGLEESKVVTSKLTKSKSNLADKVNYSQDLSDFITELSTMACLHTTRSSTYQYVSFQKLPFNGHFAALPLCNKISQRYDSIFICYDCSIDKEAAYLCQQCFEKGKHDSHRFSVFPNNNGWGINFCRCGDQDYLKKKIICETHLQAPIIKNQVIDKKQLSKFSAYFHEAFRILFGLMEKNRASQLMSALFSYLQKMTDNNLYFSKIVCQFLLENNKYDGQGSNLSKFIKIGGMKNFQWDKVFRNLSFAKEYKIPMLKQFINGINQNDQQSSNSLYQLIINFSGKIQILNSLAKTQNLSLGVLGKQSNKTCNLNFSNYYELLIKRGKQNTEIWKCLVRNQLLQRYVQNYTIMKNIIKSLANDEEYITLILQQLLKLQPTIAGLRYILQCLMILVPEYFIPSLGIKKSKSGKSCVDRLQKQFISFYNKIFLNLNTLSNNQQFSEDLLLILPYFSFGQSMLSKLWQQLQKRVQVISKNKQKQVIKQASQNIFSFITKFLQNFMTWDHKVLRDAAQFQLISYTKEAKLIEKVLIEYFDKNAKLPRLQMLSNVDIYTQKQRNLAQGVIKSHLRYNARKGKYYNISKVLPNNPYHYEEINIQNPLKFTEWQQFISKSFFTQHFFRLVPKLIKITQKALMDDIQLVKKVSNISVCLCLLNKNQKKTIKQVTRNFIKQIPDVKEQIYYVLTRIRDRLELDVEDLEESGRKGTKKLKLDLITQIRDKKYRQIKQRQNKIRLKYLKEANKLLQSDHQQQSDQNYCNICKEKSTDKRRFIYPCNFTRNNVVSTLLKSDVTDLDINICLHKVHEDCFEKQKKKGECFICKFQVNCYIPQAPLAEQSYTKNWLRKFENIVTNINMQSGKSFNSDWATIFLTYLIYSKSFKVIMKNTEIQDRQRSKADELIIMHYKSQLQKWPQLTKQAIKKADKTVKGQVTRQSNLKKVVKTLVFDLVLQQILGQPMKNPKRVEKKFRELINIVGTTNAQKINEGFAWSRDNAAIKQIFDSNVSEEVDQLFKIRELPGNAADYLAQSSIKCPMCNKYQPTAWQCLFCAKISCQNCINPRNHCFMDHKGSGIILSLSDAKYEFYHDNRNGDIDSLYRNQFQEGWIRSENPEGWQAKTQQIYNFFDTILHSQNPFKKTNQNDDDSDNEGFNNNRGWGGLNNNQIRNNELISQQEDEDAQQKEQDEPIADDDQQDEQEQQEDDEEKPVGRKSKPFNRFSSKNRKRR